MILSKHTAFVVLAAVLCLHAFAVPTRGAEPMTNPMLEESDSSFKKPSSKQNVRQRDRESRPSQRSETKNREQTLGITRSGDERPQSNDGQTRFARPSRERSASFQSDATRSDRVRRSPGIQTAMNAQEGLAPSEDVLRLDGNTGKGDRGERPRGDQREIRRSTGTTQSLSPSGSTLNAQEGLMPQEDVLRLDGNTGKGDRRERPKGDQREIRRSTGTTQGLSPSGSTLNTQEGTVPPTHVVPSDPQRQDHSSTGPNGGTQVQSGSNDDGVRVETSGDNTKEHGDQRSDAGRDRRDGDHRNRHTGDTSPVGMNQGDDDGRRDHRSYDHKDRHDGDKYHSGNSHYDKRHYSNSHNGDDRRHHTVKHVIHHIPPRHTVFVHGRDRYHYHSGRYYRPWGGGFILVRPPLGLIVLSIPFGSRMVVSSGFTYHVFGDVFYRRVPAGYEVVEPIRDRASNWPDQVTVVTDLLNVRYGPHDDEEVIAQIERYAVLNVLGSAPGWLYVEIEGEDVRGWVMERYVVAGVGRG